MSSFELKYNLSLQISKYLRAFNVLSSRCKSLNTIFFHLMLTYPFKKRLHYHRLSTLGLLAFFLRGRRINGRKEGEKAHAYLFVSSVMLQYLFLF